MRERKICTFYLWLFAFSLAGAGNCLGASDPWRTAVYGMQFTETRFVEVVRFHTRFRDSWAGAVARSRLLRDWGNGRMGLEGEVQAAWHGGEQHHFEINAALFLRGRLAVLPGQLHLSMAHGLGPSIASSTPRIERERHDRTSRRLVFMPSEISLGTPCRSREAFIRIHHRSGVFDLVSRGGGSNLVGAGFRWIW